MNDIELTLMKLLMAKPFQRDPKPEVSIAKLMKGVGKLGLPEVEKAAFIQAFLNLKARGIANTKPKIILPAEMDEATFVIWLTPIGRDQLKAHLAK